MAKSTAKKAEKPKDDEPRSKKIVQKFWNAKEELDAFLNDPDVQEFLHEFSRLATGYNQTLDEALRAVKTELSASSKDRLVVEGLGAQKKTRRYYDVSFLIDNLPIAQWKEFITERIVHDLDTPKLEQLLRQGDVDDDIVRKSYHEEQLGASLPGTPKPIILPPIGGVHE